MATRGVEEGGCWLRARDENTWRVANSMLRYDPPRSADSDVRQALITMVGPTVQCHFDKESKILKKIDLQ